MAALVVRKCERCGHVQRVPEARKHCHQPRFGRGSYACWGSLQKIPPNPKWDVDLAWTSPDGETAERTARVTAKTAHGASREAVNRLRRDLAAPGLAVHVRATRRVDTLREAIMALGEEGKAEEERGRKVRGEAQAKLTKARKRVADLTRKLSTVTAQLKAWEAKTRRYEREATLTDAEIEARRERGRKAAAARGPKRRGIALK